MNADCPALCSEVRFALTPVLVSAVATALVLLANWLLKFLSDTNRSS